MSKTYSKRKTWLHILFAVFSAVIVLTMSSCGSADTDDRNLERTEDEDDNLLEGAKNVTENYLKSLGIDDYSLDDYKETESGINIKYSVNGDYKLLRIKGDINFECYMNHEDAGADGVKIREYEDSCKLTWKTNKILGEWLGVETDWANDSTNYYLQFVENGSDSIHWDLVVDSESYGFGTIHDWMLSGEIALQSRLRDLIIEESRGDDLIAMKVEYNDPSKFIVITPNSVELVKNDGRWIQNLAEFEKQVSGAGV